MAHSLKNTAAAKRTGPQLLGFWIMWAGVAVLATGIVYEGANLPWRTYLQNWGIIEMTDFLPDPAPITDTWYEGGSHAGAPVSLPDEKRLKLQKDLNLELLGYLKLPKIGLSENVVEGSGDELYHAVGHIPGTALPGKKGNSVLPGHRNYIPAHPFRNLDQLVPGDAVIFEDRANRYTYEVFEILVVDPGDVWVTEPVQNEDCTMTLITCTPLTTMTQRLIVRARLISSDALPAPREAA